MLTPTNARETAEICADQSANVHTTALIVEWINHAINGEADDEGKGMFSVEEEMEVREQIISMIDAAQELKKALIRVSKRAWDNRNFVQDALNKATKAGIE